MITFAPPTSSTRRHPEATFAGRAAGWRGARGRADHPGISRPVTLAAEYLGHVADPRAGHRAVFTVAGT